MKKNRHECTKRQRRSCRGNYVNPIGHNRNKIMITPAQKEGAYNKIMARLLAPSLLPKGLLQKTRTETEAGKARESA